jgi:hypothetical protein
MATKKKKNENTPVKDSAAGTTAGLVLVSTVSVYFKCMEPLPRDADDPQPGVCAHEIAVTGALETEYDAACPNPCCARAYHISIT